MKKYLIKNSLALSIVWTVVIFLLCSTPGHYIPNSNWLDLLSFDKFVHASIFFTLTCLWSLTLYSNDKFSKTSKISLLLIAVLYGGLLEVLQATVFSHRSGDWFDFIANTFGCALGLWFFNKNKLKFSTT